jgi:two-component system, chemotaxis family, sensor kinase CheA
MSMDSARETFRQEAADLLSAMEDALLSLEQNPGDADLVHQVFRAMHTIKGTAGVFGFEAVVAFTHTAESVMDDVRSGERPLDSDLIAVLLDCRDHTAALVEAVIEAEDPADLDDGLAARGQALIDRLTEGGAPVDAAEGRRLVATEDRVPVEKLDRPGVGDDLWVIALTFRQNALRNGMDPLSFLRYLASLGEIASVVTAVDLPEQVGDFDPESCYLRFQVFFHSDADKATIEAVFEFAEDDCDIVILPPRSAVDHYLELLDDTGDGETDRIGEILVHVGALTRRELARALDAQAVSDGSGDDKAPGAQRIGEILVAQKAVDSPVVDEALKKQQRSRDRAAESSRYIRVDAERLGNLINLVGELVINSAAMRVMVERHGLDDMQEVVEGVDQLVEEIRDHALQLRMVQIGETLSRFRRVVRDVSRDFGKDIDLQITGGETELDKTVVEKINDPLTHLIRNALDHGIEPPDVRVANGKPARGTVSLHAYHDSGHIVIEIRDDGAGLDPERIRQKAIDQGLVRADQVLSREEVFRLIFEPGLSTKNEASSLSGRGVGMDVVRRNIEGLRGSVELDSEPGRGTTVTIILPLTLAIIDGFLVGSGRERYVIPLAQVVECVEMSESESVHRQGHRYINLRGEVLPYLHLKSFFGLESVAANDEPSGHESLVVVRFGHHKAGLVVDQLHGELQTVIKPLGAIFEQLRGVAGATVLGTGDIALILDVQELTAAVNGVR